MNRNRLQIDGPTESIMALEPLAEKWKSFGWNVQETDGHSPSNILRALDLARGNAETSTSPQILIAHTTKGRGVSFMENCLDWHYRVPSEAEYEMAIKEVEACRCAGGQ
ncbi:hypothetical protein MTX20_37350 [Bradyrhizobium sp. ISRA435]|nr:hypothetical protein MTX20_37350 [Bradyrhizobium sp. ISRA435]